MMDQPDKWQARFRRERIARQESEQLLEDKSRELYQANRKLEEQIRNQGSRLVEQEELFESVFHASMDGIILINGRGRIIEANHAALRMLGHSREIIIGSPIPHLIVEQDKETARSALRQVTSTGYCRYEAELIRIDGSTFPAEIVGSRALVGGKPIIQGILRDITQRRRALADLQQARDEAEKANEAKSLFLASMSHEIRTPLNGVLGFTEIVLDTELNAEQRQHLDLVKSSGDILLHMIDDLLDFSRIESGKLLLEEKPFSLHQILEDVVAMQSALSQKKGLALSYELSSELPIVIKGDRVRVQQVITNLVSNALKFTSEGSVKITVTCADKTITVSVKDTGIGFDESMTEALFDSFTQADVSTTRKYGGTGLGLSICRRLAGQMGGEITAHGNPGTGAEFIFRFPLAEPPAQTEHPDPAPPAPSSCEQALPKNRPVLVAEDHQINARLVVLMLSRLGYPSEVVNNGIEVIETLKSGQKFAVILMDRHMHGMDGIEATTRIRKGEAGPASQDIPIIALTASTLAEDREKCLAAGMDAFLSKPLNPGELETQLTEILS